MGQELVKSIVKNPRKTLGKVGTVADIAHRLGVSRQYVYQEIAAGRAPTEWIAKFGRAVVYDVDEFVDWHAKKRAGSRRT